MEGTGRRNKDSKDDKDGKGDRADRNDSGAVFSGAGFAEAEEGGVFGRVEGGGGLEGV